jgi:uncharacterized protein
MSIRNTALLQNARARFSIVPPDTPRHLTARFVPAITAIDREQWETCFAGELEGYGYHQGVGEAGIGGFDLGWYVVEEDGGLLCAAPVFETRYDLATTAQGAVRALLTRVQPWIPGQLKLGLSCLGSPVTETCQIGFAPHLDALGRESALKALMDFWLGHATSRGFALHGLKDISGTGRSRFEAVFAASEFRLVASMPSASLAIDFRDLDGYLARLSPATRKDMRRKLKARDKIRVEDTRDIDAVLPQIVEMYRETRARSDWAFEDLDASYFKSILRYSPATAFFKLYWWQDQLVGANLLLGDGHALLDKFFVMKGREGRDLNLYFVSWFENISHCLAHRIPVYQSGQAGYETKLRLGSELIPAWIGFRHNNRLVQTVLRLAGPLLAVDQPLIKNRADAAT